MTNDELNAIESRWAAATPGPWTVDESTPSLGYDVDPLPVGIRKAFGQFEDAAAIAAAPTDIAALIAEVRRLQEERDTAVQAERDRCARLAGKWARIWRDEYAASSKRRRGLIEYHLLATAVWAIGKKIKDGEQP